MNAERQSKLTDLPLVEWLQLPLQERVVDYVMELLLDADELRHLLRSSGPSDLAWVEERISVILEDLDDLMKRLCA